MPEQQASHLSSFPPHAFRPGGLLSSVNPEKLPTPTDALPGFSGPPSPGLNYSEISDAWQRLHVRGIDAAVDPRRAILARLVSLCRSAGLFYSDHIKSAVADALSLPINAEERQEYSAFGTDLSFAGVYLQRLNTMAEEAQLWADSPLKVRNKLPAIRVNNERITTVRVVNVHAPKMTERDGQRLALRPARIVLSGRNAGLDVTLTLSAGELNAARQAQLRHAAARRFLPDTDGTRVKRRPVSRPSIQDTVGLYPQQRALTGGTPLAGPAARNAQTTHDAFWELTAETRAARGPAAQEST